MEDAIEICSGCGKMPRSIESTHGQFVCMRCGNRSTIQVKADDYEKVVTELDARFHAHMQKKNLASARLEPIVLKREEVKRKNPRRVSPGKAVKKKYPKRPNPKTATNRKAAKKKQSRRER